MRAHDVRHLRVCPVCKEFGDRRAMVSDTDFYHGACYVGMYPHVSELLERLPREDLMKFTISDLGWQRMRELLDKLS